MAWREQAAVGILATVGVADVLSAVVVGVGAQRWDKVLGFALLAAIVVVLCRREVPVPVAAACAACLLVAQWGTVLNWYASPWPVNAVVHFVTPGSVAAVVYFLLVQARLYPAATGPGHGLRRWAPVLWVSTAGVSVAVLWEFYEWTAGALAPHVGYTDTIVDLFAGTLGSLTAGLLVAGWAHRQGHRPGAPGKPDLR